MPVEALVVQASYVGASLDKGLQGAQKELAATAKEANKLDSSLAKGLTKGSNTAGQSLINLGRIAQDAPFGFIGIQNNINPLLESFQRLKVETGSTGGALKALAGSLIGAGGIGLAVSLVTSLLTVLTMNGFFKTEKAADSAAEANKKYKESLEGIFTDVAKEVTQVNTLIAVLNSETETRQRKLAALKELKQINPEIFNGLKLEEGAVIGLDNAYQNYIKNIKNVIAVKQKQAQIENIITKILKLEGAEQTNQAKSLVKLAKDIRQSVGGVNQGTALFKIKELADQRELRLLNQQLTDFVSQITELSSGVKLKIDPDKEVKQTTKDVETISSTLQNLAKEIQFLNTVQLTFGTDESAAKIKAIEATIKTLIKDFKVDPQDTIIQKLLTGGKVFNIVQGLNIPGIKGLTKDVAELIETEALSQPTPTITIPINVQTAIEKLNSGGQGAIQEFLVDATDTVNSSLEGLFENIAINFGETLGKVLAGQASIGDFFKGIFNQLGASMKELGKFFIQTGIQIKVIKAFLLKNPALAIAGGIALVALGSLLQAKTNTPAFATGGTAPGGSILVGERGPEIITAPRGATITPNAQTNAMLSGANGGTVVFRIQGRELVGVLNNTNATLSRNGQG
jgi:hypothetical protein